MDLIFPVRWKAMWRSLSIYMSVAVLVPSLVLVGIQLAKGGISPAARHLTPFDILLGAIGIVVVVCLGAGVLAFWSRSSAVRVTDTFVEGRNSIGRKIRIPLNELKGLSPRSTHGLSWFVVSGASHEEIAIYSHTENLSELIELLGTYLPKQCTPLEPTPSARPAPISSGISIPRRLARLLARHPAKFFFGYMAVAVWPIFAISCEHNAEYSIAFKYLSAPITLLCWGFGLKYRSEFMHHLKRPYEFWLSFCTVPLVVALFSAGLVSQVNAFFPPQRWYNIDGRVVKKFESGGRSKSYVLDVRNGDHIRQIPVSPTEYAHTEVGDRYRRTRMMGPLGFTYAWKWRWAAELQATSRK